jgi:hypothetical protein
MPKGICKLSVIPLRSEPSSKSEMVTQILFGETYTILEVQGDWVNIKTDTDHYEAWISHNQFECWDEMSSNHLVLDTFPFSIAMDLETNQQVNLLSGSILHEPTHTDSHTFFKINNTSYQMLLNPSVVSKVNNMGVLNTSKLFLNSPYLWGGRTFLGIDCSGFTQLVYKLNGVQLPRDAYQQAELGEFVVFLDQAKVGDLAFFVNDADKVTHVGLLLGDGKVIHASGKVRIDKIDSHGIFDEKQGKHTHILKCIKRIYKKQIF